MKNHFVKLSKSIAERTKKYISEMITFVEAEMIYIEEETTRSEMCYCKLKLMRQNKKKA